jgi:hypothetical protein
MDWKGFGKEPVIASFKVLVSCNLLEGLSKTTKHLVTLTIRNSMTFANNTALPQRRILRLMTTLYV